MGRARGLNSVPDTLETPCWRSRDPALQDPELMSQDEDLDILGLISSTAKHKQVDHETDETDETVETGHLPILAAFKRSRRR